MRIPRNKFSHFYFSIRLSSISILKCRSALLLCLILNIIELVLSVFRDSLFCLK